MQKVFLVFVLLFSFSLESQARFRPVFKSKADDLTVNDKCETYSPNYFLQEEIKYFLVGIKGTKRAGFHEEVDISRDDAKLLWVSLNPHTESRKRRAALDKINRIAKLSYYYGLLDEGRLTRGAEYYSEGEVLEILSYKFLPESDSFHELLQAHFGSRPYTENDFFITGGVTYHSKSGQTVGELDVVVGDSHTCTIFGIGEAKLGGKRSKALRQLDRIKQFLRSL